MKVPEDERDLGALGEKTLELWASQVGITINKAHEDKRGWDYFLELRSRPRERSDFRFPLDKEPAPVSCFIQVKSTDGQERSHSVKLSNWAYSVKKPEPFFFLVFEFDHQQECQRAFLVHVGEQYIGKTLKRLRETDPKKRDILHKMRMDFSYGVADSLRTLDGNGLRDAIMSHVGGSFEEYVVRKLNLIKTLGYEDGKHELDLQIAAPDPNRDIQDLLADFAIGLVPSLEVVRGTIRDVRFGIVADEPAEVLQGGTIALKLTPVGFCTILLSLKDKSKELRFETEVYPPQGLRGAIEPKYHKLRFALPFVDFLIWPLDGGRLAVSYGFPDPREPHVIRDLRQLAQVVLLLHEAFSKREVVEVGLKLESASVGTGQILISEPPDAAAVGAAHAVLSAWELAKHFDVFNDTKVNLADLLRQQQRLSLMAQIIGSNRPSMSITFKSTDLPEDEKEACIPVVVGVILGQYRMVAVMAMFGRPHATGKAHGGPEEYLMDVSAVRMVRQYLLGTKEELPSSDKDLKEAVAQEYEQSHTVIIIQD